MTLEEVETLVRAISNTYPTFRNSKEVIEEWYKRLAHYDYEDVEKNFNNYVLGGNTQPITIVDLIRGIYTKEQKQPVKGYFYCSRCNRRYRTIKEADECYERDLHIAYIKKMSDKFNIRYTEYFGNLYNATLEDINKNYDQFIIRLADEQKKNPILKGLELEGLRTYYKQVIMKR